MADLDLEQRHKGLRFASELLMLASKAPDVFAESKIHALVFALNRRYGFSRSLKKIHICKHLATTGGTSSIGEIVDFYHWHVDEVTSIVNELVAEKRVERYISRPAGSGRGRNVKRIRLIGPA